MRLAPLFLLTTSYAAYSLAQESSVSDTEIFTIQTETSINPTRTSTRIGGSQIQPSSFSTSRLTISDASTDRPTLTTTTSGSITLIPSTTATSPGIGSTTGGGTSAASSPTTTSNAGLQSFSVSSIGLIGALATISGVILL